MADELRQIVVSLPRHDGIKIKHTLKDIAKADNRSMSNQVCKILINWLNVHAAGWDDADGWDGGPARQQNNGAVSQTTTEVSEDTQTSTPDYAPTGDNAEWEDQEY